jgi:DNA-binding cell septation regulator SpoVG
MPEKAKPAGANGGHRELSITNWKVYEKNTLRAFFSLSLPSGLIIHNCALHQKDGARWIGLPSRQYQKDDGSIAYSPLVQFVSKDARQRFQATALEAMDRFMEDSQ